MKNRLCELLGIRYPIIQGGMAWSSDGTLAAAVSNAGGAGIIGTGGRTTEWVIEEIRKANDMGVISGVTTNPSLIAKIK